MAEDKIIILPSDPLNQLNDETDLFGLLPKANLIKNILTNQIIEDKKIKMVALYGHWGSGKTTLMNHLINELKDNYTTLLFEAWKLEKDTNLALSLLEQLLDKVEAGDTELKKVLLQTGRSLFTLAKNLIYSVNIDTPIVKIDPGKAAEKTIEDLDAYYERKSYYAKVEAFKAEFLKLEEKLKNGKKKIFIFIDDLDRCEPENVLNLLSAIKLFFAYSSNIVFYCGIDKNAVSAAIRAKYKDIINHEDYLEKIFDISFNMPEYHDVTKILRQYFPLKDPKFIDELKIFFNAIEFNIPRHIIKALNKYSLLKQYKKIDTSANSKLIPDINDNEHILSVVFTLYFIILYEFSHKSFLDILNYEEKFNEYAQSSYSIPNKGEDAVSDTKNYFGTVINEVKNIHIDTDTLTNGITANPKCFLNLLHIFTPRVFQKYSRKISNENYSYYINQFESAGNHFLTSFCKYLEGIHLKLKEKRIDMTGFTPIRVLDLFEMAQMYL